MLTEIKSITTNLNRLRSSLKSRNFKIYSCYYCESTGNYIKLKRFSNKWDAGKYYGIGRENIKSIEFCIDKGSHPHNGKLLGSPLNIVSEGIKSLPISFFSLEDETISKALVCYTLKGEFLSYFNNVRSAADFLGVSKHILKSHILSIKDYRKSIRVGKALATCYNVSVKVYSLNLKSRGLDIKNLSRIILPKEAKEVYGWAVKDGSSKENYGFTVKSYRTLKELQLEWKVSKSTAYRSAEKYSARDYLGATITRFKMNCVLDDIHKAPKEIFIYRRIM